MARLLLVLSLIVLCFPASAQDANAPIQKLLQEHGASVAKASRKTIGPTIDALAASGLPEAQTVLEKWQAKAIWRHKDTGLFVWAEEVDRDTLRVFDFANAAPIGTITPVRASATIRYLRLPSLWPLTTGTA